MTHGAAAFHEPVHLKFAEGGHAVIRTPGEAREALLATWPQTRGKWYHAAGRACSAAMEGRASVHVARRIFLEAAQESRLTP